jgi:hypothetical protein
MASVSPQELKDAGLAVDMTTPIGKALFLHIVTPDYKYKKEGLYKLRLVLDPEKPEDGAFLDELDKKMDQSLDYFLDKAKTPKEKKAVCPSANTPYYDELDEDDNPTGLVYLNVKMVASGERKDGTTWERSLPVFDSKGKPVSDVSALKAGNGTKVRVALDILPYFNSGGSAKGVGLSLRMKALQIIDIVEYGSTMDADELGFGAVEGGFEANAEAHAAAQAFEDEADYDPEDESANF